MKHIRTYRKFFNIGDQDTWLCEHCRSKAVDIHHIYGRGKDHDIIENLVALCRSCHNAAHNLSKNFELSKDDLVLVHRAFMKTAKPEYKFNINALDKIK